MADNVLSDHNAADKAIIALCILKDTKPANSRGIGPNRDDGPIFRQVAEAWYNNQTPNRDLLFQARHRIKKYARQAMGCRYGHVILDNTKDRTYMLQEYKHRFTPEDSAAKLARELEMLEKSSYGVW